MKTKLRQLGTSRAVIIPSTIIKLMGLEKELVLEYDGEKIIIKKDNKEEK